MIVLHDPETLLHATVELLGAKIIPALESPQRIVEILAALRNHPEHGEETIKCPDKVKLTQLIRDTHNHDYLQHLEEAFQRWVDAGLINSSESILPECFVFPSQVPPTTYPPKDIYARAGYFAFDMSSGIMDKTYTSIIASANLALGAVCLLHEHRQVKEVLALCRPPGHHCNGSKAGGYCYINNAAVAISAWRSVEPNSRVGVLDVDYHHGNGTQDIFYADGRTFYTSIHGADEFPYYTGKADELGKGQGFGANLNLPLDKGSSFEEYCTKLEVALSSLSQFDPEFLVVSLGFDTFHEDPLGSFQIHTEDYQVMARMIRTRLPDVPAVILLEGGYVLEKLGVNLLSFLKGWESSAL